MKRKSILFALLLSIILPLFAVGVTATSAEPSRITSSHLSRYSSDSADWFAEGDAIELLPCDMPDTNNTGHITPRDELVPFAQKYAITGKTSSGGITYTITDSIAEKYNYVFEGFSLEKGCFYMQTTKPVVFRDFYINAGSGLSTIFNSPRVNSTGRTIILDGELIGTSHALVSGFNMTVKRCYLHDCWADHVKGFSGQVFMYNFFAAGGLNGGTPHPDCIQFSVDDGHGKGLATENVYILGNRMDNIKTTVNSTNCCIILKSEFGGGVRNIQIRGNWMNGGGTIMQVAAGSKVLAFFENVVIADNHYGRGAMYTTDIMYYKDHDGVSFSKKVTDENNNKINDVIVSSVSLKNDGRIVQNLSQLTGEKKIVQVMYSNYTQLAEKMLFCASLKDSEGKTISTITKLVDVPRCVPYAEYSKYPNYKEFRFFDLPMDLTTDLDLSAFGSIPADATLVVDAYLVENETGIASMRQVAINHSGVDDSTYALDIPEGYFLIDDNPNSDSAIFISKVNDCYFLGGQFLLEGLREASKYYAKADDAVSGVLEAKANMQELIAMYNATVDQNDAFLLEAQTITQNTHSTLDIIYETLKAALVSLLRRCLFAL